MEVLVDFTFKMIMIQMKFVGSNDSIFHREGLQTATLSDLVTSIEFMNTKGEQKTFYEPA